MNQQPGAPSALVQMAPLALILVVFYFLVLRPQQKKAKETDDMLAALKVGDEIVSVGGMHGKIVRMQDGVLNVEVAPKVQIKLERSSVTRVGRLERAAEKGSEKA